MDELLQEFILETRETLEALTSELIAWETHPSDSERLDSIFRFFHTVKGSCGFLNLPRFERLSHEAEDVLSQLRDGTIAASSDLVTAILGIIDRISALTYALETGEPLESDNDDELIAHLRAAAEPSGAQPVHSSGDDAAKAEDSAEDFNLAGQGVVGDVRAIRVPLDLLDQMMNSVSDMVLARNEVARRIRDHGSAPGLDSAFERLSTCIADLRDAIGKTRMQRIERIFAPLPRFVRDLCHELGKDVQLVTTGNDVELDREMIEMIRDPLMHIIRNSLDHGIEDVQTRENSDKPSQGRLHIAARQSGNQILLEIEDDGRGIDVERLVSKAVAAKVCTSRDAQTMSDKARLNLIFAPGLSTAQEVTAISGRGVGMDVVRSNIEQIGGSIDLENTAGRGLRVIMRVPLTLTIIACLTVTSCGAHYALPRAAIREILHSGNEQVKLHQIGETQLASVRGETMPMVKLAGALGMEDATKEGDHTLIVMDLAAGMRFVLNVDSVLDHEDLVVRPGAPMVMANGLYAGTTLPDNGRPMLLLDPMGLASAGQVADSGKVIADVMGEDEASQAGNTSRFDDRVSALLFRDTQGRLRAINLNVIERVEDFDSKMITSVDAKMRINVDGRSLPIFGMDKAPDGDRVKVLHLSDGQVPVYFAINDIVDIFALPADFEQIAEPGLVCGVTIVDGKQVEIIDPYWIFATLTSARGQHVQGSDRPQCLLSDHDDPWTRNILAPLIQSAGYEVIMGAESDHDNADIIIRNADDADDHNNVQASMTVPVIRLRSRESGDPATNSIYRYDRVGLLSALQADLHRRRSA